MCNSFWQRRNMNNIYCFSHNYTIKVRVLDDRDFCNVNVCYLLSQNERSTGKAVSVLDYILFYTSINLPSENEFVSYMGQCTLEQMPIKIPQNIYII